MNKKSWETNILKKGHVDYRSCYHKNWGCCNLTNYGFLNVRDFSRHFLCPYTGQNTQSKIEFSKLNLNFLLFHRLG